MKPIRVIHIILLALMGLLQPLLAADNHPVTYLTIEQGLSNNAVTSIFQDSNGFMWFGTYDGLNRYDGYNFRVFRNTIGDSTSLSDNHVYAITEDRAHHIWVGSVRGISVYNPSRSRFTEPYYVAPGSGIPQKITRGITVIATIDDGATILAGSINKGLIAFNAQSLTGSQIPIAGYRSGTISYSVNCIEYDPFKKKAWVFSAEAGLCLYDANKKQLQVVNSAIKQASCMRVDRKGRLWIGNSLGLYLYDEVSSLLSADKMTSRNAVANLYVDKQNTLWVASDGGGLWLLPDTAATATPYLSSEGKPLLNSNVVYAFYEDTEGRKWIGTLRGGVNVIQPRTTAFKSITYNAPGGNDPVANFVLSFAEDEKNNLWIGTDGGGLRYWDRKKNQFTNFLHSASDLQSVSSNFITNILKDAENNIWVSTWFNGISRLKKMSGSFERFKCHNPFTNTDENNVWLVFEDRQKRIWASTVNNGTLYYFDKEKKQFELFDKSIINVQSLFEDGAGNLWAGTYTALIRIDRDQKKHKVYTLGYPVRSILEDKKGQFWIGTEGGGLLLFNRKSGSYQRFTTNEGLPNNSILRLLEDGKGNLWFSTYNGICKFNIANKSPRNFSHSDGLQSNQFSFNAGLMLSSGEFAFGGIKGFNIFYPDSIYNATETPRIFLTGLKINNVPVEEEDSYVKKRVLERPEQITIPYEKAVLSFDFVALGYSGSDNIKYAFLLEGWDKNWNYVNNTRTAFYSRLQEGDYTFKIKATNAGGVWGPETKLLQITVLPPWYRTWWAYCLYVLLVIGTIYGYAWYSKKQERLRYEIKLAHLESQKEKEMAERRISFFTHISHEFRSPLTLIINPIKDFLQKNADNKPADPKELNVVYRNARRLLSLVDQLLLFRKVETVDEQMRIERWDIVAICNEVMLSFNQHAVSKQIRFHFEQPGKELFIYCDIEKIEIVLFNLLSNALKYTPVGGSVSIRIEERENELEIIVRDTGIGIPADVGEKLFDSFYRVESKGRASKTGFGVGLFVSQKLAEAHGGKLSYTSVPAEGTEFRFRLRKGKAHLTPYAIGEVSRRGKETLLQELVEEPFEETARTAEETMRENKSGKIDRLVSELPSMVIVDDNAEIRTYVKKVFSDRFNVLEADDGVEGFELVRKENPDIVISDIMMKHLDGIELCRKIKETPSIAHIPVILLTASPTDEVRLKGIEGGAEEFLTKPFDKEIIVARVENILKGRNRLQQYFLNAITLKPSASFAGEHKEFIENCIAIVERHLDNPDFTIQTFCKEIGMSHPSLYKKIKLVSGLTVNVFIRYLRLRKAAELLINTNKSIVEVTYITGFNDIRYFREQFYKLFEMNPSDYVKRYRKVLRNNEV